MRIILTFDVEIWCQDWRHLDEQFPKAFERYVYGESRAGSFALPETLNILAANGLRGVFFVEPLFAARFGIEYLRRVISLIQDSGQEIQLHLHPEWADEITPPPLAGRGRKRPQLRSYSLHDQSTLIALGIRMLQEAGAPRPTSFRAGNFGANEDTFRALAANGIQFDSSVNAINPDSVPDLRERIDLYQVSKLHGVTSCPLSVFRDGTGQLRHAQVGACSGLELEQAISAAAKLGWQCFVILSHNFEMLKSDSNAPDWLVVKRFRRVCAFLKRYAATLSTSGFDALISGATEGVAALPTVGVSSTLRRHGEQALRRLL